MENIFYEGQVIWAQIDANRHMRHSAYADICAQARSNMLNKMGFSLDKFAEFQIGPILFREELIYSKEVHLDEYVQVKVELTKYNKNNSRFSFVHQVYRKDGALCCTVHVDGAWLDLKRRKLTKLPEEMEPYLAKVPRAAGYEEVG
nr:thioesterase family protein [uncultured Sphingobacterium sp.]